MFFRLLLIPLCFCISTTALAVLKWQQYPCGLNQRTIYDSVLLVEGESLHLSCSICEQCEPKLTECSPDFSIAKYIKLAKTSAKLKNFADIEMTDAISIRERVRSRLYVTENIQNFTHKENNSSGSARDLIKNHTIPSLNIYYTIEKPSKAPEKITFTKTRFFQPRVFVYKDQLVLRKTLAQDSGVYTCVYRGRPRIVWAVTVLPPGVEPYRQTIAPMVTLDLNQVDINPPQKLRTLKQKTVTQSNVQMFTSWGPWSECVPCVAKLPAGSQGFNSKELGGEGFQMRVGTCYVRMVDSFLPLKPYKLAFHATKSLKQFGQAGLPCRSHLIELGVQDSGIVPLVKRPSELIIRPCYKPCPAPESK
ncbi:unnamed protein product [Rodentolepis nana]|uniref:Ig-like domain-containing protein n=1 Tax=Rodentolepis nana TaxID=102285 RepID=A0A0R3TBY9_RODNA|nr:unnamed protein product [Rodentolepis nana]